MLAFTVAEALTRHCTVIVEVCPGVRLIAVTVTFFVDGFEETVPAVALALIKSNASGADVTEFHRSVLLYERQTGRRATRRILVAVTIQVTAEQRARELGLVVATDFGVLSGH